ncbi:nicotinate-nucleotide--dimethylbenzimidazole phosphoribosyltransferase [Streptomyces sp. 142MFCol3.1]|uniref:nicotinate-nucleotide--dimethylbenzimidazole phosphoribosyltransferase n=1 Tax=Streptomyces sp. 142MFCol3.1 TaxID=1172179 RepID=UPI000418C996|nr:nicotinate-nucleotide--dimethylbenzimidazole phosphoribosyltransferase [Streptomyces sp. 142MFCol3.1]
MTDTGQVPGDGLPESAGMVEQPGVSAPGAYTYLDPSETPAEDDDLLLMPGAQGAWGNEVAPPAPMPFVHEPGPHEASGRDSGAVDLGAVRAQEPGSAPQPVTPRRPLHLGPPTPDVSASPVRSLADRGPAGSPVNPMAASAPAPPVRHAGPPTAGPEYLDVPQLGETPPQGAVPWGAPPVAPEAGAAETAVPEAARMPFPESVPGTGTPQAPQAAEGIPAPGFDQAPEVRIPAQDQVPEAAEAPVPDAVEVPVRIQDPDVVQAADGAPVAQNLPDAQGPAADGPQDPHMPPPAPETHHAEDASAPQDPRVAHDPRVAQAPEPMTFTDAPLLPPVPQETGHTAGVHIAVHGVLPSEGEHFTPAQGAPVQDFAPADAVHQASPQDQDQAPVAEPVAQADQPGAPALHDPEQAVQYADVAHAEAAQTFPAAVAHAPEAVQHALSADTSHGQPVPGLEAVAAQRFEDPAAFAQAEPAESLHGVPVGVAAHGQIPRASAGRPQGEPYLSGESAGGAGLPVGTPPEAQEDHTLGQFVPVEGTVPTTPHLAPTPPHAMTVPPLPEEEQPAAEEPADEMIVVAPAPTPVEESAADPAEATAVEPETVAPVVVPAPREGEPETGADAPAEAPAAEPEPLAADPEPVVAQQADDLDTQVADQEESTAAVEDVRESTGPAAPGYDDAEREAVLRVMRERRDIRNGFRSDPIPHDVLLRVLEAAHTAPSVGHSQPWDFVVIRSADTRRAMHELAARQREAYAKSLPKGRAKQFKELKIEAILDTPVNIVVTADPTRGGRHTLGRHTQPQMAPYSSALAVENLWLAARAEGLGVGWVSFFDEREMVRALGLPEHLEVVAYLCVGYVDEFPDEPELMQAGWSKRRPLSWVVHEETYGRRALPGEEPHDLLAETVSNIRPLDAKALGEAWERQKRMTKPAGALGMLEIISAQLSGLSRMCPPPIPEPAAVAIFAGDHGVHAQGVTPWPQEVTGQMVANFLGGGAVCNAFANQVGAEVCVIDVGVASDLPATPGLLPRKVRAGTADMTTGPAMTREEVVAAIEVGIETARDLVAAGNKALLTGEMGIANTTASAALISVFTDTDPSEVTGRGTGINDETLARKTEVVRRAIELHQPDPADPIGVLAALGGLEHAAMVGLLLGGASLRTPVILDGVSAGAAALVARAVAPEVLAACIAGHRSAEPGHVAALNKLGLRPLVDLDLRLGEGTGALLALPVVQSAARAMHEVATFDSAGVTEK